MKLRRTSRDDSRTDAMKNKKSKTEMQDEEVAQTGRWW